MCTLPGCSPLPKWVGPNGWSGGQERCVQMIRLHIVACILGRCMAFVCMCKGGGVQHACSTVSSLFCGLDGRWPHSSSCLPRPDTKPEGRLLYAPWDTELRVYFHWPCLCLAGHPHRNVLPLEGAPHVLSSRFVVKTQRALNDYRKSEYPHFRDKLTKLKFIGNVTAQRLHSFQAHVQVGRTGEVWTVANVMLGIIASCIRHACRRAGFWVCTPH